MHIHIVDLHLDPQKKVAEEKTQGGLSAVGCWVLQSFIQKWKASTSPSQSAADTAEQPRKKGWKEGADMT